MKNKRTKGAKPKIDEKRLEDLLAQGKSQSEIARILHVSPASISMKKRRLREDSARAIVHFRRGNELITRNTAVMDRLSKSMDDLDNLRSLLSRWSSGDEEALKQLQVRTGIKSDDPRRLLILCCREIQNGTMAHLEILKTLYSLSEVEKALNTIIEVIGSCDENVQQKIIAQFESRGIGTRIFNQAEDQDSAQGENNPLRSMAGEREDIC